MNTSVQEMPNNIMDTFHPHSSNLPPKTHSQMKLLITLRVNMKHDACLVTYKIRISKFDRNTVKQLCWLLLQFVLKSNDSTKMSAFGFGMAEFATSH